MEYSVQDFARWYTSGSGKVVAGAFVLTMTYVVRFFPGVVGKYLQLRWQQRAVALLVAFGPALGVGLVSGAPWEQLFNTAFLAFAEATGMHHLLADAMPALKGKGDPLTPTTSTVVFNIRGEAAGDRVAAAFNESMGKVAKARFADKDGLPTVVVNRTDPSDADTVKVSPYRPEDEPQSGSRAKPPAEPEDAS